MCINCNDPLQINLTTGPAGPTGPAPGLTATASSVVGSPTVTVTSPSLGNYNLAFGIPSGTAGSNGTNGADGAYGGVSFPYTFTGYNGTAVDPGNANIRFNGVNIVGTSTIHISNANAAFSTYYTFGQNLYQNIIFGVNNSVKGLIKVFKKSDPTNFAVYQITAVTNQGTNWTTFSVTNIGYAGTLSNTDNVLVSFTISGNSVVNSTGVLTINQVGPPNISTIGGGVNYSNTFLTYNSGAVLCGVPASTSVSTSNSTAIDASSFSTVNGTWNAWSSGYYQFNWYISLTIPSATAVNGWYDATKVPQAIMAGITSATGAPNQNSTYSGNQWICPAAATRQMIISGTSNVIQVNSGDIFALKLINMTGVNYVSQAGDVAKWSVTRFA